MLNNLKEITKCVVCLESVGTGVLQCMYGHGICERCRRLVLFCPLCKEVFLSSKPIMLVQVLEALPKLCEFKSKGCKAVSFSKKHELICECRPIHCMIMKPNECHWAGLVKDFRSHVIDHHSGYYSIYFTKKARKLHYKDFNNKNWTTRYYLHVVDCQFFILFAHKDLAKKRFVQVVKHIPLEKSNDTFYFNVTFAKEHLVYKHTIKACPFEENENLENDPHCMIVPLEELNGFLDTNNNNLEVTFEAFRR